MSKFGWHYPAGAANDPYAPYNQEDPPCDNCGYAPGYDCECPICPICKQQGNPACEVSQEYLEEHPELPYVPDDRGNEP